MIALVAVAAIDIAMPVLTRFQLDNRASQLVADLDATLRASGGNIDRAREMLQLEVDNTDPGVVVEEVSVEPADATTVGEVTLFRKTDSPLLRDLFGLDSWYDVTVTRAGPVG